MSKALALLALGLCCVTAAAGTSYAPVTVGEPMRFPDDLGSPPQFRTEWGDVPGWRATAADYVELTKPKIAAMVLVTVAVAACVANWGPPTVWLLVETLVGTALVAASASALNQWLERDTDAQMARTADRPLPAIPPARPPPPRLTACPPPPPPRLPPPCAAKESDSEISNKVLIR